MCSRSRLGGVFGEFQFKISFFKAFNKAFNFILSFLNLLNFFIFSQQILLTTDNEILVNKLKH